VNALAATSLAAQGTTPRDTTQPPRDSVARRLPVVEVIGSLLPATGPAVGSGVPARISVVTGDELDAWEPRLLSEALSMQPGISLYDDLGSAFKPTLVSRGFTASPVVGLPQGMSIFVDGVPVNEPDAGQVNFDLLPLEHVSRVELLSGTASLLGPHSLGGAINLVTRRGGSPLEGEIEVAGGSHDRYSVETAASGLADEWSYYVGGGWEREGGWRQLTSARGYNGLVNVGRFGARAGVGVQLFGATSKAETAGSLPQSVYTVSPDSNLSAGDFEDLDQLHVALTGYRPIGAGRANLTFYHRRHDAERFNVSQLADPDVRGFSENRTTGFTGDWRLTRSFGNGTLGLRVGAGGSVSSVHIRLFAERIDPGLTTDVKSPLRKGDVFALADYYVGRLTFSGGARYDVVRVPFENQLDPTRDTVSTYHRVSPRGGVSFQVARGASIYASIGQSFRAPAVIELACADPEEPCPLPFALGDDPPLDPVVATTYEVGGAWQRGPFQLNASVYRTNVHDDIYLFPFEDEDEPEGSSIDGFFANISATRRNGLELASRFDIPGGHALYANYAYTLATFRTEAEIFSIREAEGGENETEVGDRLPLVPDHTATLGASFALPAGFELGVDTRYTGERWLRGDEANETSPLSGFWVTNLRAGYDLGPWEVLALVRNVFDRNYAAFGTFNINQGAGDVLERFLTPGQPRTIQIILSRSFGAND
jgi:iron complex outermembrane receptor protein